MLAKADLITDLGTGYAYGINASGQVVGTTSTPQQAFFYSGGTTTYLGVLGNSGAFAVNPSGQITGYSGSDAFIYSGGTLTDISSGPAAPTNAQGFGINASGQVVGQGTFQGNSNTQAFLYSSGAFTALGSFGGQYGGSESSASGINATGTVVGFADLSNGTSNAFSYWDGVLTDLDPTAGDQSLATAINDGGQIVGGLIPAGGTAMHSFLYENGTMTDLGTFGAPDSEALAINISGQVVGYLYSGSSTLSGDTAYLWANGTFTDLNSLLPANSGWTLNLARGINDSGQIIGWGTLNGVTHSFLLDTEADTSVPEPSSIALICSGILTLVWFFWRQRALEVAPTVHEAPEEARGRPIS